MELTEQGEVEAILTHNVATHEYEMNQSESLTFLFNLLYDDNSELSKSDVLKVLNSLKRREENLSFSISDTEYNDIQGVKWPRGLRRKFYCDRMRIGQRNWFQNIPGSIESASRNINLIKYGNSTDFFSFDKFYPKLKLHISHFQLRNIVTCSNLYDGIFYLSGDSMTDDCLTHFKIDRLMPARRHTDGTNLMQLDQIIDSRKLMYNCNSRISTLANSDRYLVAGTFEGGYLIHNIESGMVGEYQLTGNSDGITNHVTIDGESLVVASNDKALRLVDLPKHRHQVKDIPFAVNCTALNHQNRHETFLVGDNVDAFIADLRLPSATCLTSTFKGHQDYGFSCDWCPSNANILLTGNQDGCIRIWDRRRPNQSINCFSGALGSGNDSGGPIRNCKFSSSGHHVAWAESLDHAGIIELKDVVNRTEEVPRSQSIDFIGKCIGLNFCPMEYGHGESLILGVNDYPLGGIMKYNLDSPFKSLDFDFF